MLELFSERPHAKLVKNFITVINTEDSMDSGDEEEEDEYMDDFQRPAERAALTIFLLLSVFKDLVALDIDLDLSTARRETFFNAVARHSKSLRRVHFDFDEEAPDECLHINLPALLKKLPNLEQVSLSGYVNDTISGRFGHRVDQDSPYNNSHVSSLSSIKTLKRLEFDSCNCFSSAQTWL